MIDLDLKVLRTDIRGAPIDWIDYFRKIAYCTRESAKRPLNKLGHAKGSRYLVRRPQGLLMLIWHPCNYSFTEQDI